MKVGIMKKNRLIIIILVLSVSLAASWVEINSSSAEDLFICEQQTRSAAEIEFNLDGFELEKIDYGGERYSVIRHEKGGKLLETGMPDLPLFTKALVIPDQGISTLEVTSFDKQVFTDILVYPQETLQYEHETPKDNFIRDENFYSGRGVFPAEIAWAGEPAIMRDLRLLPITFCPFQYNAAERSLTVYSNIRVQVVTEGTGGDNTLNSVRKRSRAFEEIYRSNTMNYDAMEFRDEFQMPAILFICPNNNDVLSNLTYLTDWKRQKGYNVVVATTAQTGTTNVMIKNYIQNAYDNWENPPEYVNIIGDGTGSFAIPTWFSADSYSGEGDHPYSQLAGSDILGDVIMGRMTFSTIGMLQTVISKILNYEKNPYMGNTAWYNKALITGDPTSSGYSCVAFGKAVKELMLDYPGNFWDDDNFTEIYTSPFASNMNIAVNAGVSFFAYRGFGGTSGWYYGSTSNGYMMPFLVMPTCNANDWYSGTGNVEGFYQMGSVTLPNGGIAAVGTATPGTHTPFNNAFAVGVWGGIFRDHIYTTGGSVLQGKYYLWLTFPQQPGYVTQFSHWNTLMGDGSLELWTRLPQQLSVFYSDLIPEGANYYEVAVLDSVGIAAEGAWVTLFGEDDDFIATGVCDYNGSVILDLEGAVAGEYTLTVTKHDHIPEIQTVFIEQVEQFADIQSYEILDDSGNGNGIVNPGEIVEIMVTLENLGTVSLNDVNAIVSVNSDLVNILDNEIEFGDIETGAAAVSPQGFNLEFQASIQGGVQIRLQVLISDDDGNSWTSWLFIPVEGANLYPESYTISGNGVLDPGETGDIYFTLQNNGELAANQVQGFLSCNNRRITITDSIGNFGNINPGSSGNNVADRFTLTASTAILPGTCIPFMLHLTDENGYDSYVTMNVEIGEAQQSDPYGPDAYGYWCYDSGDISYDKCPEYNWIEIDPDYGGSGTSVNWTTGYHQGTGSGTGTYANIEFPPDFNFVFYGEEYDELCISSNGWVAPGHHESGNFMNYQIPGPQGPSPMIAVFWDDLSVSSNNVLYFYNQDLHYYVVSWSRITNGDTGSPLTFQVIMYDPLYYPTTTGDSEIKFQYYDVINNNAGSYPSNHGQYATVGIENEDSMIGLQYTFNNIYPNACKPLEDGLAILFTPPPIPPDGPFINVCSFEAFSGDDSYIEAGETALISIILENMGAETASNLEAEISITDPYISVIENSEFYGNLEAGAFGTLDNAFSILASENVPDYYFFYLEVIISCDEDSWNWMLPFTAYMPNTFGIDQDSIYYHLQPMETGSHQFTLSNTGNIPVNYYVRTDETTQNSRDVNGSFITLDTDSFTPGEETTWTFTVYNGSSDNEWLSDVWLDFPLGVNVISAGNVIGGSGGNLLWDGTTGIGQRINWHGTTANNWGMIHHGEMASWDVNVLLSTEFAGDMTFSWEVGGDGFGNEPHTVSGEITLLYPLRWINLDISSGTLPAGGSQLITMNFDASDIDEGIHTGIIVISCDSWDTKTIQVALNVETVGETGDYLIPALELKGNYPNPFNPETDILFQIADNENIKLSIYNLKGQLVRTVFDSYLPAGHHSITWNGCDNYGKQVGSGVYFYKLSTNKISKVKKMILLK